MTTTTSENETNRSPTNIATSIVKITMITLLLMNVAVGSVAATHEDGHEPPTEEELCANAATDIIDRVMFFLFNLVPIVTFTVAAGAYAAEKMAGNKKKGEYRSWRNNAAYGTAGLVILGQMGSWFLGTFLNVSPACLDNFTYLMVTVPIADVTQVATMAF